MLPAAVGIGAGSQAVQIVISERNNADRCTSSMNSQSAVPGKLNTHSQKNGAPYSLVDFFFFYLYYIIGKVIIPGVTIYN